jgi:PTS system nitrogen regulatory IIA component
MAGDAASFGYPVVDLPPSAASSPEAAIKFLVDELVRDGRLKRKCADDVKCRVLYRESLGSTGIGRGVALPHYKCDNIDEVLGIVGRSAVPVPWPGAVDEEPVRVVCMIVTPSSQPGASMQALESAVRQLRNE